MTTSNLPEIRLRAMEPEDLDFLYGIENDPEIWNVGATNVPYSRYNLYEYVANTKNDIYADRQVRMLIENSTGSVVGIVDLMSFDPRHMRAEVGIVIQNKYRRMGYARAALQRTVTYATHTLNLHQLYAIVPAANNASLGLFENIGFERTAELKEWLVFGEKYQKACLLQFFLQKDV